MMGVFYALVWGFAVLCGLSAVYGLVWAVRNGQVGDFRRGAASIFDDEEPVGFMTDRFPGEAGDRAEGSGDGRR
jgi:nitrogen fixation-related uncharacterized protein